MGDFDRKEKKAGSDQSKQITLMILLGVVLIGVVGYHFSKGGPTPTLAAGNAGGGIPMPVIDETPEQASNALKQDPTASLLRQTQEVADPTLDKVPHNPFLMGDAWRTSLVREEVPVLTAVTPATTTQVVRTTERRQIPAPKAENFKLASILRQGGSLYAIINGRIVSTGAVVGDARVVEISEGRVVLQSADFADGPKTELNLSPQLK